MLVSSNQLRNLGLNSKDISDFFSKQLGITNTSTVNIEPRDTSRAYRGLIAPKGSNKEEDIFFFQFNPETISDTKGMDWFSSKYLGFSAPELLWVGGQDRTISFELFLDATSESLTKHMGSSVTGRAAMEQLESIWPNGVMDEIEKLQAFQYPSKTESPRFVGNVATPTARFDAPPILVFSFGPFYMECALTGLDVSYEFFDKKLVPRRARLGITLLVYEFDRVIINNALPKKKELLK